MLHKFTLLQLTQTIIILIIFTHLLACGGGGGGGGSVAVTKSPVTEAAVVNTLPVISGSPSGSVTTGAGYSFQPDALDTDGDPLTFSIRNKPVWASFSTGSGRLSGTPSDSHAGLYSNIVISVTDGTETVGLSAFSIQVSKVVLTGSFSVGWTAPVMRSDGTPLSLADINGYRLYYGTSPGVYADVAEVSDGAATAVTVTGVPLGTRYIVMTTYDAGGRESIYSGEISKIVQ